MINKLRTLIDEALIANNCVDVSINIENVSHKHANHFQGNGNTHFVVIVQSPSLMQMPTVARHRILNGAVSHLLQSNEVHSITFSVVA